MEFSQLALLVVTASVFGLIAKNLKQPLLVGYLFAGLTLSLLGVVHEPNQLDSLAQIGVTLLLFLVGLEMDLNELPTIGKTALLTGIGQIVFTSGIGFAMALLLGFSPIASLYIAIGLTFSSTIIIIKLLSEKQDMDSLYGKISVGFLLIQDFVAVVILMILAGLTKGGLGVGEYLLLAVKAVILFGLVWYLSKKVLPYLFDKFIADSPELLFIVSIAWALGVSTLVAGPLGFSLEIGGFLAGLALSSLPEHLEVASRTRPLRDFFLVIFFLLLGSQLVVGDITSILPAAILLSIFVLIGNPVIVMAIMGLLGYKKRTSFMSGLTVAQISEFSLIIMAMGVGLGHTDQSHVAMMVLVAVITMTLSTYLILGAEKVFKVIKPFIGMFERSNVIEAYEYKNKKFEDHVVLVGSDRTGTWLLPFFKKKGMETLVIDFNPVVYERLNKRDVEVLFGDVSDIEVLEAADLQNAKIIVSTINNLHDNLFLLEFAGRLKSKPVVIVKTGRRSDAQKLYDAGADYVIVPDVIAGEPYRPYFGKSWDWKEKDQFSWKSSPKASVKNSLN